MPQSGRDSPATAIGRTVTVTNSGRLARLTNGYSHVTSDIQVIISAYRTEKVSDYHPYI
jgi:hypothetical protein